MLRKKYQQFCILFLFAVYPVGMLPAIWIEIYNKRKYAFILLAIFMALFSIYYFPFGDQYRYYMDYKSYDSMDIFDYFNFNDLLIGQRLNLANLLLFLLAKMSINFEICRFLLVLCSYIIIFTILFDSYAFHCNSYKRSFIISLIAFLLVPFFWICFGYRTGVGAILFVKAIHCIIIQKNNIGWIYAIFSVMFHFMYILPFVMLFLPRKKKISKKTVIILFLMASQLGTVLMLVMVYLGNNFFVFASLVDSYITGSYGVNYQWNIYTIILFSINSSTFVYLCFYFYKKFTSTEWSNYLAYLTCLVAVFIPFQAPLERYIICSTIFLGIYYIYNLNNKLSNLILISLLSLQFVQPFVLQKAFKHSECSDIMYSSIYGIMNHTCSEKKINQYIYNDGTLVK